VSRTVGKYRLEGVVGGNRFGRVYQAEHFDLAQVYALQVIDLPSQLAAIEDEIRRRFHGEASVLQQLEHPGIVRIVDYGEDDDKLFIASELVEGRSLRQVVRAEAPFPEERASALIEQVLDALRAAHEMSVAHGGLSPDGILVLPERSGTEHVALLDFGLAWTLRGEAFGEAVDLRTHGVVAPQYAAPEQFRQDATPTSDVYSAGLLLWEMLTGRPAVDTSDAAQCMKRHQSEEPWTLPANVAVTPGMRNVLEVALAHAPEHRFADAEEMLLALRQRPVGAATLQGDPAEFDLHRSKAQTPEPAAASGEIVGGKYQLLSVIGTGSFSQVYKGIHVDMDRPVAVKLLDLGGAVANAPMVSADELRERFRREARLVSKLANVNTITLHDFGIDDDDRCYIVMEYVEGFDLSEALFQEGVFEPQRAAQVARDILESLSEAHHLGILHRDLKPGNVMLAKDYEQREVVKVLDFGLATVTEVGSLAIRNVKSMSATQEGVFMGTPQYAAPEQFLGQTLTPSTDVYAVGLVLWEMLTGVPACDEDTVGLCLKSHLSSDPWRMPEAGDYPAELLDILYGALEKEPQNRYQSATEMAADLDAWLAGRKRVFRPSTQTTDHWEPAFQYQGSGSGIGLTTDGEDEEVIDPNLRASQPPDFLSDSSPSYVPQSDGEDDEPPAPQPIPVKARLRTPIELDRSAMRRSREPAPASPPDRAAPRKKSIAPIVAAGVVVFAVSGVLSILWKSSRQSEPPPPVDSPAVEEAPVVAPEATTGRFTSTMILDAVRAAGWKVEHSEGSASVGDDVYRSAYTIRSGGEVMQLHLLVTRDAPTANKLAAETRRPAIPVLFDEKLVRLIPTSQEDSQTAISLSKSLTGFRDAQAAR